MFGREKRDKREEQIGKSVSAFNKAKEWFKGMFGKGKEQKVEVIEPKADRQMRDDIAKVYGEKERSPEDMRAILERSMSRGKKGNEKTIQQPKAEEPERTIEHDDIREEVRGNNKKSRVRENFEEAMKAGKATYMSGKDFVKKFGKALGFGFVDSVSTAAYTTVGLGMELNDARKKASDKGRQAFAAWRLNKANSKKERYEQEYFDILKQLSAIERAEYSGLDKKLDGFIRQREEIRGDIKEIKQEIQDAKDKVLWATNKAFKATNNPKYIMDLPKIGKRIASLQKELAYFEKELDKKERKINEQVDKISKKLINTIQKLEKNISKQDNICEYFESKLAA